jgi:hypothetical protein
LYKYTEEWKKGRNEIISFNRRNLFKVGKSKRGVMWSNKKWIKIEIILINGFKAWLEFYW